MSATVPALYNARAAAYDDKTSFHRNLATEYIGYAKPQSGESLLDLACGTGLVTYAFAPIIAPSPTPTSKPRIVGIDISSGMLEVARSKLPSSGFEITFLEHDITDLSGLESHGVVAYQEGKADSGFDVITICSALVLLPEPGKALKHWATFLKPGGRLVVDVPHVKSMLSLRILSAVSPEFGVPVLGDRRWVKGEDSLRSMLVDTGLEGEVVETAIFADIPARTEEGRDSWGKDEGARIWERVKGSFGGLGEVEKEKAKERFVEEWTSLADGDGIVKEEGRLYVGIGKKS